MNTFRDVNAAIKAEFKHRAGFLPAKCSFAGSIPAVRFAGDMPVSLACDIARWLELNCPAFINPLGRKTWLRHISFGDGGVVLNWS